MNHERLTAICMAHGIEQFALLKIDKAAYNRIKSREENLMKTMHSLSCTHPIETRFLCLNTPYSEAVKTLLVVLAPYDAFAHAQNAIGVVDGFAYGYDYHTQLRSRLSEIREELAACEPLAENGREHVDTSPYIDREIALYAGLGKYGKNHLLINTCYGTQFFIGYLTFDVDLGFEADAYTSVVTAPELYDGCKMCSRCERVCPAGICGETGRDPEKCVGMLTQLKRPLTALEMSQMGNSLYGCSLCQNVCPSNAGLRAMPFFECVSDETIDYRTFFSLTNKAFKRRYGGMAFSWRGLWVYKRNLLITMGNTGDSEALTFLEAHPEIAEDDRLKAAYTYACFQLSKRLK
ncbi:epoxyqueuosine reductase [Fusibacter sp. JL298sf-3]